MLSSFYIFVDFPPFILLLISSFILLYLERILSKFKKVQILQCMFYVPSYGLSWRMLCVHLRRIRIVLPLDGMFYKYLLGPFGLMCDSWPTFPHWFFCLSCWTIHCWQWGYWSPILLCIVVYFPFRSIAHLLTVPRLFRLRSPGSVGVSVGVGSPEFVYVGEQGEHPPKTPSPESWERDDAFEKLIWWEEGW